MFTNHKKISQYGHLIVFELLTIFYSFALSAPFYIKGFWNHSGLFLSFIVFYVLLKGLNGFFSCWLSKVTQKKLIRTGEISGELVGMKDESGSPLNTNSPLDPNYAENESNFLIQKIYTLKMVSVSAVFFFLYSIQNFWYHQVKAEYIISWFIIAFLTFIILIAAPYLHGKIKKQFVYIIKGVLMIPALFLFAIMIAESNSHSLLGTIQVIAFFVLAIMTKLKVISLLKLRSKSQR